MSQILTFVTAELEQPKHVLLFSVTKRNASGTKSVTRVPVYVNYFAVLRPRLALYLGTILSPDTASDSEEETSEVLFMRPFLMCCTFSIKKDTLTEKYIYFLGNSEIPPLPAGDEE